MPDQAQDVANRLRKLSKGVLPPGGIGGRVLRKASDADYDVAWQPDDGGLPPGGVAGDVVTKLSYVDGDAGWAVPSTGRVSGYYVGGSPVSTSVPTASVTNLAWPTFTIGSPILDLSTIDTPVTQTAGEHTIEATVAVDAAAATGTLIIVLMRITDGTTPYGAEVDATILGSATNIVMVPLPLTAVVAPGSTIEILALQTSGGAVDVRVDRVAVTGPPPP